MEKRWLKLNLVKSGSGTRNYRINLPTTWVKSMFMNDDDRDVKIMYDTTKRQIVIEAYTLQYLVNFVKKAIEKYAGELGIVMLRGRYNAFEKAELKQIEDLLKKNNSIITVLQDLRINKWNEEKNYISILDVAMDEYRTYVFEYLKKYKVVDDNRNFKRFQRQLFQGRNSVINSYLDLGIEKGYAAMMVEIEKKETAELEKYFRTLKEFLEKNN